MKYINFGSVTFWSGFSLLLSGVLLAFTRNVPEYALLSVVINDMVGNQDPFVLITTGLGMIGIRKAIRERQ